MVEHTKVDNDGHLAEFGWYEDSNRKFNVHGEIWNTDIHAKSSKDDNPIVNSDGHFRVRRGGPLPGAEVEIIQKEEPSTEAIQGGDTPTPGYAPEPEFIDGADGNENDDWMAGLE